MLSTINVRVARPDGKVTLKERRVLRFVKPGGSLAGTMCIARHKKAIIVTHIIDHGLGLSTLYGHLSSIDVKEGEQIKQQQIIGKTGETGLAVGDHLLDDAHQA